MGVDFANFDEVYGSGLDPKFIGWSVKCPRCRKRGLVDDVNNGYVIVRHDSVTWHVVDNIIARRLLWDRGLLPPPKRRP